MIAKALADGGAARVYIVGRRVDVLQQAAASINRPTVVVPLYCDATSKVSLESIVSVVETDVGHLDLLVCNAGIGGPQVKAPVPGVTTLDEWRDSQMAIDFEDFTNTFRVNGTSVWFTAMAFLKLLDEGNKRRAGNGPSSQVVVTSSIAAFNKAAPGGWYVGDRGTVYSLQVSLTSLNRAYGASKAAATHIAKMLSVVLPTWGIRANCLCPGRKWRASLSTLQRSKRIADPVTIQCSQARWLPPLSRLRAVPSQAVASSLWRRA
jgi:NAD(P)-dependent dehydrogenase (short-subunit alcohol dehydrogenase family)